MTILTKRFNRTIACLATALSLAGASTAIAAAEKPIVPMRTSTVSHQAVVDKWITFWNGDLALAHSIVAPDFALHATLLDGRPDTAIRGPSGLTGWVEQSHAVFGELRFTVEVGPVMDGNFAVVRWVAQGSYRGGIPGAQAAPGTPVRFTGTDILRIENGKVKDYWLNADTGELLKQLKVGQGAQ